MISPHKKIIRNQEGAAMIEFAIILPVLLLFIFGIIEFSLALFNQQVITNAAREGARRGVIMRAGRDVAEEDLEIRVGAENLEIGARIKEFAESHLVTFGDDIFDAFDTKNVKINPDVDGNDDLSRGLSFGDDLIVQVTYDYKFLFLFDLEIGSINIKMGTITLSSVSTMKME